MTKSLKYLPVRNEQRQFEFVGTLGRCCNVSFLSFFLYREKEKVPVELDWECEVLVSSLSYLHATFVEKIYMCVKKKRRKVFIQQHMSKIRSSSFRR